MNPEPQKQPEPPTGPRRDTIWINLQQERLRSGHPIEMIARGHSMRPLIPDGTRLTIEPITAQLAQTGDLLLARRGQGSFVLHRAIFRWGNHIWLKGDRNRAIQRFESHEILGRALWVTGPLRKWRHKGPLRTMENAAHVSLSVATGLVQRLRSRLSSSKNQSPPRHHHR